MGRILPDLTQGRTHAQVARDARRAYDDEPKHLRMAPVNRERDSVMLSQATAEFLAKGGKVKYATPSEKLERKAQVYMVRVRNSITGKIDVVCREIPAINVPIIPKRPGVVQYCAPRSRG